MVWFIECIQIEILAWCFEMAADDLGVDIDRLTHLNNQHCELVTATSLGLHNATRVDLSFEVFFPSYSLADPSEDGSKTLDVTSMWSANISLSK